MNIGGWVSKRGSPYPDERYVKSGDLIFTRGQFNNRINQTSHPPPGYWGEERGSGGGSLDQGK